jgi:hypothetical protein
VFRFTSHIEKSPVSGVIYIARLSKGGIGIKLERRVTGNQRSRKI